MKYQQIINIQGLTLQHRKIANLNINNYIMNTDLHIINLYKQSKTQKLRISIFRLQTFKSKMFMGGNRGGGQSFSDAWNEAPFFYKFLVFTAGPLAIVGIFTSVFLNSFLMVPALVFRFQIWRLFTSWLVDMSIINTLFALFSLYFYIPAREKKLGTAYTILDFFVMTTIIQLFLCIIQFIGSFLIQNLNLFGLGLWSMWMIYISRVSYATPEQQRPFCCFPCTIKSKYFPIAFLVLFSLLGGVRPDFLIAFLIGLAEYLFCGRVLIKYPVTWIMGIQRCLPSLIKRRSDFTSVDFCQSQLLLVCRGNPMANREPQRLIAGSGLTLGSSQAASNNMNQQQLRDFWANKDANNSPGEYQIQYQDTVLSDTSERQFK